MKSRLSYVIMEIIDRSAVFPTTSSQSSLKCRLICARKGCNLLQKKVNGLLILFRKISLQLLENKSQIDEIMKDAAFSLTEVNYTTGGVNELVLQTVNKAKIRILSKQETIGGVRLQIYEPYYDDSDPFELTGLGKGGQQVIRKHYNIYSNK